MKYSQEWETGQRDAVAPARGRGLKLELGHWSVFEHWSPPQGGVD